MLEPDAAGKRMKLRYAGICRLCGANLSAGVEAIYEREAKAVRCVQCPTTDGTAPARAQPEAGTAGASARREFERRHDRGERAIREAHPKLGGLILAVSNDPQSTQAWNRGAQGEEILATRLADLPNTFRVLHDRRIRGTRANIDHIAVGPSGVWVIDAKRYKGKRPELRVEGGVLRPRVETLRIAGRDATKLVRGIQSQVARVSAVLPSSVPIHGVLCFIEADWPLIGGSFTVDGVHVTWPRALIKRMTAQPSPDEPLDVDATFAALAVAFPVA